VVSLFDGPYPLMFNISNNINISWSLNYRVRQSSHALPPSHMWHPLGRGVATQLGAARHRIVRHRRNYHNDWPFCRISLEHGLCSCHHRCPMHCGAARRTSCHSDVVKSVIFGEGDRSARYSDCRVVVILVAFAAPNEMLYLHMFDFGALI
jgi:hypothetical protein